MQAIIDEQQIPDESAFYAPMDQEVVLLFVGPRGSGKSMAGSWAAFDALARGIEVYANMPVRGTFSDIGTVEAKAFDTIELYSFGQDIHKRTVYYIDEFDKICAARWSAGSNANRLLDWIATQIRKLGVSFILTAQQERMIDPYWRAQIDVLIMCKDLCHSPWGKDEQVDRGTLIFLECRDVSGVVTGRPWNEYPVPYACHYLAGKNLWGKYDTHRLMGVNEMLRRFEFAREVYTVGRHDNVSPDEHPDISGVPIRTPIAEYISGIFHDLALTGHKEILGTDLDKLLQKQGINIDHRHRGQIIERLGVKGRRIPKGVVYELGQYSGSLDLIEKEAPSLH